MEDTPDLVAVRATRPGLVCAGRALLLAVAAAALLVLALTLVAAGQGPPDVDLGVVAPIGVVAEYPSVLATGAAPGGVVQVCDCDGQAITGSAPPYQDPDVDWALAGTGTAVAAAGAVSAYAARRQRRRLGPLRRRWLGLTAVLTPVVAVFLLGCELTVLVS